MLSVRYLIGTRVKPVVQVIISVGNPPCSSVDLDNFVKHSVFWAGESATDVPLLRPGVELHE